MLISMAYAQEAITDATIAADAVIPDAPSTMAFQSLNWGFIILMVVMFYFLLIRPQQKRFKEHQAMIDALKKGDKVVTSGGLIGTVDKLTNDKEIVVDLGNGMKVNAVRNTVSVRADAKPATKDDKKDDKKADEKADKKPAAKKSAKKTAK